MKLRIRFHRIVLCCIVMVLLMQLPGISLFAVMDNTSKIDTGWSDTGKVDITINTKKDHIDISPYIYGLCSDGNLSDVTVNAAKQSGSVMSSYNWETNFANMGSSGKNSNDISLAKDYTQNNWRRPALFTESLISKARRYNIPFRYVTLQMMGYAANDSMGTVTAENVADRFARVEFNKNGDYLSEPDITDKIVYMDEYVSYLTDLYGYAADGGISGYFLDYEPEYWNMNYSVLGLSPLTAAGLIEKSSKLAGAVKKIDPTANVFGPSIKGLESFANLNNFSDWENYYDSYSWFIDYYLDKMSQESKKAGIRLLDVLDLHFISEANDSNRELVINSNSIYANTERMQAVRLLWDSGYTENSISAIKHKQHTPIIPTLQASIRMFYPGTKLSFSEYNFGGGNHISGAIAQADVLGIFASYNVYMACLLPNTVSYPYQKSAINLYTNYNGNGASFGDTLVKSDNGGDNMSSVYAAINGNDENTLKAVLINKNNSLIKPAEVKIESSVLYDYATVYCIDSESYEIRKTDYIDSIEYNSFSYQMSPLTIYLFEFGVYDFIQDTPVDVATNTPVTTEQEHTVTSIPSTSGTDNIISKNTETVSSSGTESIVSESEDVNTDNANTSQSVELDTDETGSDNNTSDTDNSGEENDSTPDAREERNVPVIIKIIIGIFVAAAITGIVYILFLDNKK